MAEDQSLEGRISNLRLRHVEAALRLAEKHGLPDRVHEAVDTHPLAVGDYGWHIKMAERLSNILRGGPYVARGQ